MPRLDPRQVLPGLFAIAPVLWVAQLCRHFDDPDFKLPERKIRNRLHGFHALDRGRYVGLEIRDKTGGQRIHDFGNGKSSQPNRVAVIQVL